MQVTNQAAVNQTTLNIKQWGNSLGMRLPSTLAKQANLHLNQRVSLTIENGRVIITPAVNKFDSLEERLAKFDAKIHTGEVMTTNELLGAEKL